MIDVEAPGSPGWWLQRVARKLEGRQKRLQDLHDRYAGNPPLPEGAENVREAYRSFQRKARTNYSELIVEATRERMAVTGFRTAAASDDLGDAQARELWEANGMDVESADVHTNMLSMGDAYVIVGRDDDGVTITGEDARQVVTIHDPVRQRVVRAAGKVFHDGEEGVDLAYLYLPGRVYRARRDRRARIGTRPAVRFSPVSWDWDEEAGGEDGLPTPGVDRVAVVRFRNRRGVGEFEPHLDVLDRINHQILQRMVIATMQAFRQRAAKNLPLKDEAGKEIDYAEMFPADPGAMWALPGNVELWESAQVDLTPILSAVKDDVVQLAAVTRTPLPTLMPGDGTDSAEGAAFKREGLVFKAEDRIKRATEGWKDVMSLAFQMAGDEERADRGRLQVLWASPERRSLAERADAASKATDLPFRTKATTIWGFAPAEVDRMEQERAGDLLIAALGTTGTSSTAGAAGAGA